MDYYLLIQSYEFGYCFLYMVWYFCKAHSGFKKKKKLTSDKKKIEALKHCMLPEGKT